MDKDGIAAALDVLSNGGARFMPEIPLKLQGGGHMSKSYKLIDLFAGAGGMTLGFQRAGFVPVLAVRVAILHGRS